MKMTLYHASKNFFEEPDLARARDYKDFGRGFYLTTNLEQALSWAARGLEENNINNCGYVYQYAFEIDNAKMLHCLELKVYNEEWVDTVAWYRNNVESHVKHELIYDRMADGHYRELVDVLQKYYRKKASVEDVLAIAVFMDSRKDQYCFKTKRALSCIERVRYAKIYNYNNHPKVIKWYTVN